MQTNIVYGERISYKIGKGFLDRAFLNKIRYKKKIGFGTKEICERTEDKGKFNNCYLEVSQENVYMRGDWQNESYFLDEKEALMKLFTFRDSLSHNAIAISRLMTEAPESVAVHCRRGDYVSIGISMNIEYYLEAMKKMKQKVSGAVFFIFSEDPEWVKQNFSALPYNIYIVEYVSQNKDIEDFRLISQAKHQIVCNSSYSWWAAYLNQNEKKHIICPCMDTGLWGKDFWPEEWEQILVK